MRGQTEKLASRHAGTANVALIFALPLIARPLNFSAQPHSSQFAAILSRAFGCADSEHLADPVKVNSFPKNCGTLALAAVPQHLRIGRLLSLSRHRRTLRASDKLKGSLEGRIMMSIPSSRRQFLTTAASAAAFAGTSQLGFLNKLPSVS